MRIAHVASEIAPYSQTGGLAQVAAALPEALARMDGQEHGVCVITPLHRSVASALEKRGESLGPPRIAVSVPFAGRWHEGSFRSVRSGAVDIHFFDCPSLFDRDGIYEDEQGPYPDNAERFSSFCRATLEAAKELMGAEPDLFHCHDWPTGLLPILLRTHMRGLLPNVRTVFTIHNLAYQGCTDKQLMEDLHLPWSAFSMQGLEFYDQVSLLKAGIAFSDATTTVSQSYAEEIRTPEFGCTLDGFLRHDCQHLLGIRNGIDVDEWNPRRDPHIKETFDADEVAGKQRCRRALLSDYGLDASEEQLVVGVVSRLAEQKGLDLVAEIVPELHDLGVVLVLLGNGESDLEERFGWLSKTFAHNLAAYVGFDTVRAHRVFAGADAFLMPSRFEPCGLGQMAAMRYGTLPIVHAVGGLRDTVDDPGEDAMRQGAGNGFSFDQASLTGLRTGLSRAARLYREEPATWLALMQRGMKADWSWSVSARKYAQLYMRL